MANREQLPTIRAARAGDPAAQLALGRHYLFGGGGLPKNIATALHWLDRAAHRQIADAWILIGRHVPFETARHVADAPQLLAWYEKALEAGVMQAGLTLAQLVLALGDRLQDACWHDKAMLALQTAAQAGIADAQWLLAQQQERNGLRAAAPLKPVAANLPIKNKSAVATSLEWTACAADAGILAARYAMAERAWAIADHAAFLRWSLPLARELAGRANAASG